MLENLRKVYAEELIYKNLNSKTNEVFHMLFNNEKMVCNIRLDKGSSKLTLVLKLEDFDKIKTFCSTNFKASSFYLYNQELSLAFKLTTTTLKFTDGKIDVPFPAPILLKEKRGKTRRSVINADGFIKKDKLVLKSKVINYHEDGIKLQLSTSAGIPIEFKIGGEYKMSIKEPDAVEHLAILRYKQVINSSLYLGFEFVDSVYVSLQLLPEHLEDYN